MVKSKSDFRKSFSELVVAFRSYNDSESDLAKVRKAWRFARLAHTGQKRLSGEAYAYHALEVAKILVGWKLDTTSIVAGFLHDTIEDGGAKGQDIVEEFGQEVAILVDGVSKVSYLKLRGSREEEFVENLRKMFLAMARDLRVILVKLSDRLHNMRTLYPLSQDKQKRIARETLEVYAPLAERLGMGEIMAELEDLAFPYVYPEEFEKIKNDSALHYKSAEEHIQKMKRALLKALAKEGIKAKIDGRKKHLFSLWKKLEKP